MPNGKQVQGAGLAVLLVGTLGGWLSADILADDADQPALPPTHSSRSATAYGSAEQSLDDRITKLKAQQEDILKRMDEVLEQLEIVKTRATLH